LVVSCNGAPRFPFTLSGVVVRVPRVEESGCAETDRIGDDSGDKKCLPSTSHARFAEHFPVRLVRAAVEQARGWAVNRDALLFLFAEHGIVAGGPRWCADHGVSSGKQHLLCARCHGEHARRTHRGSRCFPDRSGDR